jgi:protein-tyrosine-phosphatase
MKIIGCVFALVLCVGAAGARSETQDKSKAGRPPTVLFMCPHGAAKSVLASAYFQRAANERGLNVRVISAGTEPDSEVSPAVKAHLQKNGYEVPATKPRRVTADDMATADVVISIGCDMTDVPPPRGTLVKWDDVPSTKRRVSARGRSDPVEGRGACRGTSSQAAEVTRLRFA